MPDLGWSEYVRQQEDSAYIDAVFEAQWFEDEDGDLLIPDPWDAEWLVDTGISPEILDKLNKWYREHYDPERDRDPLVPKEVLDELSLRKVDHVLKRYNEVDGFYHA
jgi:hypothetical protein